MNKLSSIILFLIVSAALYTVAPAQSSYINPVLGDVDLSSNFCEHRPGHFHGGIDIRTGGREGRKVYSPVDGYVWRIKYSFIGYGKGLYLKDSQGYIYVFGHLSGVSERLEKIVEDYQYRNRVYSFDNFYEPDSIPVTRGELIAFSGQTGYGAPHIHFEVRNPNNMPLNPLTTGFTLDDQYPPQIAGLGFISEDSTALHPNGYRRIYTDIEYDRDSHRYFVRAPIPLTVPFGVTIKAFDRIRPQGPSLNIYRGDLYIDSTLYYEISYDRYDYAETREVDLSFDYPVLIENNKYWHLMFIPEGKRYEGSKSILNDGGVFGKSGGDEFGLHRAQAEFFDASGNRATLDFRFVMLPKYPMYEAVRINDTSLYLEADYGLQQLDIDTVKIEGMDSRDNWRPLEPGSYEILKNGDIQLELASDSRRPKALKAVLIGKSGWRAIGNYVVVEEPPSVDYRFSYEVIDGGIRFHVSSGRSVSRPPFIDIAFNDGYTERIPTEPFEINKFAAFYRAGVIRSPITRFDVIDPDGEKVAASVPVNIMYGGSNPMRVHEGSLNEFRVSLTGEDFYMPAYLELEKESRGFPNRRDRIYPVYSVNPKGLPLADYMTVAFKLDKDIPDRIGLYRLNDKDRWVWLDHKIEKGQITAESRLLGTFAVLNDTKSPRIRRIFPGKGKTTNQALPQIRCRIDDDLSGIGSDEQVTILLDGDWVIPEYDPETEILKTRPRSPLKEGRHTLQITVADRSGNSRTVDSYFFVNLTGK